MAQTHTGVIDEPPQAGGPVIDNPQTGERMVIRRSTTDTGGSLFAFELFLAPDGHVPGAHVHPFQEERFRVVRGHMRFLHGLRHVGAGPGETVTVTPGTIHRFQNAGDEEAHVIVEVRPALRMEELLRTTADLAREGRTLPNGMPRPLDFALFLEEFERELAVPVLPGGLVRAAIAPLARAARRRGLDARYRGLAGRIAA
ncbi:MAG: cupin domain-containing protein [bacterium]|jgi:quercetin dioxygenase-like cupin family protein|nr:cupin domain-containing protein [bacterium]